MTDSNLLFISGLSDYTFIACEVSTKTLVSEGKNIIYQFWKS